uniref:Secreted protein n=1 Tax=Pseudonaja textilis TaxID=8673 RepID=A0A670ZPT9_PSETE
MLVVCYSTSLSLFLPMCTHSPNGELPQQQWSPTSGPGWSMRKFWWSAEKCLPQSTPPKAINSGCKGTQGCTGHMALWPSANLTLSRAMRAGTGR